MNGMKKLIAELQQRDGEVFEPELKWLGH